MRPLRTSRRARSASGGAAPRPLPALPPADARAERRQHLGQAHALALHRQQPQHLLLGRRAARDLLVQQPPYAPEDAAAASLLQEGADVAAEELADALADQGERQAVAPEPRVQLRPLRAGAAELLRRQQRLGFVHAEPTQLQA